MARVLFWLVLGFIVWWWIRTQRRGAARPPPGPASPAARTSLPQPMLRCAHCGLHLPRGEALLTQDGQVFCGDEHRALGPAGRG